MIKKLSILLSVLSLFKGILGYSCNPNTCKPPSCTCASQLPPGGIDPKDAPQFVILSYDDAVNDSTFSILKDMYKGLAHSNGCPVVATHFVQNIYTNYHQVQQLYAQGDEIALHTFGHTALASQHEINSGRTVLSTFAGIPLSDIRGFRAPFLNYTNDLIQSVQNLGLAYDSSAPTIRQDASWPYTLDNGFSDTDVDCNTTGTCGSMTNHNGLWEIPLYSFFYNNASKPPISMDPPYDNGDLMTLLKDNFNYRYNGNRQPLAIAVHAVHCNEPEAKVKLFRNFIKWCIGQKDVYFITYSQLIEYMKNPVKASDLEGHPAISCSKFGTYKVNSDTEICDGIDNNGDGNIDEGVVENCGIGNSYFSTCFGCPTSEPSIDNPTPLRNGNRKTIPQQGCVEGTWDPLTSNCVSVSGSTYLESIAPEKIITEENNDNPGASVINTSSELGTSNGVLSSHIPTSILIISMITILIHTLLH